MSHLTYATLSLLPVVLLRLRQTVNVEWNPEANLEGYETYEWIEGTRATNQLSHQRVVSTMKNELTIRGWSRDEQAPGLDKRARGVGRRGSAKLGDQSATRSSGIQEYPHVVCAEREREDRRLGIRGPACR